MAGDERSWTRRTFLRTTAASTAVLAAGCGDEDETPDSAADASADGSSADAGGAGDVGGADAPADAASDAADTLDATDATQGPRGDAEALPDAQRPVRTKGPYLVIDGGAVRWAVESAGDASLTLVVEHGDDRWQVVPETSTREIDFMWPPAAGLNVENRDEPGTYTVHTATVAGLPAGERVAWTMRGLRGGPVSGTVRVPQREATAFHAVWVSDTMFPASVPVAEAVAGAQPDLLLHGGDIQYQSNPLDTWNGYFLHFGAAMAQAPMHYCIGNHEYEQVEEIDAIYGRLFGIQGDGPDVGYHAFTWGGWRFVMLNSEVEFARNSAQGQWAEAELAAARDDAAVNGSVVCFHRPFFTFSKSSPNLSVREDMHALFVDYGVTLVLTGHNHCYERFEVDGITYIVDGGGGASLYDPNDHLADIEAERPEELALRVAYERTHGWLSLRFDADGGVEGVRTNDSGDVSDTFTLEVS